MPLTIRLHPFAAAAATATVAAIIHFRRRHSHIKAMGSTLVLSAKSQEELNFARALKQKFETSEGALKLSEEEKEVRVMLDYEVEPTDQLTFGVGSYLGSLVASRFGRLLLWSPRLSSTHDLVSKNFHELPCGTVCITDVQFKGRGRSKNIWESPLGCLLFSFTLQMEDGKKLPLLQYVVSLAVSEAIKELCRENGLPQLDVRIKWPNDLYLEGLKVGGILCTSTYQSEFFNVSAGVGLNVDNQKPTTCLNSVLEKMKSNSSKLTREQILASFFNKFEDLFEIFVKEGFNVLEDLYCKTWLHSGQKVVIEENIDGRSIKSEVTIQLMEQDDAVVSVNWLHQNLQNPEVKVLDASWYMPFEKKDAFQLYKEEHIPGALFFDIDRLSDLSTNLPHMLPSEEAFASAVTTLGITNNDKIIVYDGKGMYSAPRVWWTFRVFGHDNIWVLDGGFPKWKDSGFEVQSSDASSDDISKSNLAIRVVERHYKENLVNPTTFKVKLRPHLIWTLEKIKQNVDDRTHQHIDARVRGRFDGTAPEPRKGVRSGHIPGSKCVPFPDMLDSNQLFLPPNEIHKKFENEGISLEKPIVVSCASGVTACIVALGLYKLGKKEIPVYDGSWTEWECQPGAIIVTVDSATSS